MFLAPLLLIFAALVAWLCVWPPAWAPLAITAAGRNYDQQFALTLAVTGVLFVAAHLLLAYVLMRYRKGDGPVSTTIGSRKVEILWTVAMALTFAALGLTGARLWGGPSAPPAGAEAETIEVTAHQFAWNFRYAGPDHRFGHTDVRLIDDAAANPFGLDLHDPAALDDRMTSTLRVPVDTEIQLILKARDVIHDFFVRELRLKQDVVPGMEIPYRFRADRLGVYEIACSELCGLGHSQMRSTMQVMPKSDYTRWIAGGHE